MCDGGESAGHGGHALTDQDDPGAVELDVDVVGLTARHAVAEQHRSRRNLAHEIEQLVAVRVRRQIEVLGRAAHSLKGMSATMGYERTAALTSLKADSFLKLVHYDKQ